MFFPQRSINYAMAPPAAPLWEMVSTASSETLIDVDVVKTFLNLPVEDKSFDDEKMAMVGVAQSAIEEYCQMVLLDQVWMCSLPDFAGDWINLIKRPFRSVTKVEYVDQDTGEITTLPTTSYGSGKAAQKCGYVVRADGVEWPDVAMRMDGVRITVACGFEAGTVPREVLQAVLITTAAIDRSRADDGAKDKSTNTIYGLQNQTAPSILPPEAKALLAPWKYRSLGVM